MDIFNQGGGLSYSTDDVTWNQVDSFVVNGGEVFDTDYPVLEGREVLCVQVMIDPPPIDRRAIAHTITVTGTHVSVSGGTEKSFILVMMR